MLCAARDSDSKARSIRSGAKPRPSSRLARAVARKRVDECVRVGGVALGVEQFERCPRVPLAAHGIEVAVDRQLRMASRLQRAIPRGRREGLLATCDRRLAALAPVVETSKVEEGSGLQPTGAVGDGKHDHPRTFGITGLDEVVAELERAPIALVGIISRSQLNRQLGKLDGCLRRAAPPDLARRLRNGERDRGVRLLRAQREMPRALLRVHANAASRRCARRRSSLETVA